MSRLMFRRTTQTGNLFYGKNFSRQHGAIMLKVKIEKTTFMKSSFERKRKAISIFLTKFGEFADRLEANIKDLYSEKFSN